MTIFTFIDLQSILIFHPVYIMYLCIRFVLYTYPCPWNASFLRSTGTLYSYLFILSFPTHTHFYYCYSSIAVFSLLSSNVRNL